MNAVIGSHSLRVNELLSAAGLRAGEARHWWRTLREELGWRQPRQALIDQPAAVLALAEADVKAWQEDADVGS